MRRTAVFVGSVACCLLIGSPGNAAAQPSEHEVSDVSVQEVLEDFCGTGVDVVHTFHFRSVDFLSPQNADFAQVIHGEETFTYNGITVTGHFADRTVVRIVEGEEGGARVEEFTVTGVPEMFKLEGRRVLTKDVGRIVLRTTFDAEGNFVDQEITFDAGPHPDAEGGFELFCPVMTEALGIEG